MSRQNRPTDPFGGPRMRGNNISLILVLAALAFFAVLQWTARNGGITTTPATVTPTTGTSAPAVEVAVATGEEDGEVTPDAAVSEERATPVSAGASEAQSSTAPTPSPADRPTPTANAPPTAAAPRASNLPTIAFAELPPEAHDTIALIEADGPFPFNRDGITFQNRERILPRHPEGYYREYTVITPGSRDRGARRIVTGERGEMYYTDDHYDSFREIVR